MPPQFAKLIRTRCLIASLVLPIVSTASAVLAHHSFVMFDGENMITIKGKVVEYKFANPHAFILLSVTDEKGGITNWSLEGASAASLTRAGWSGASLKPGDEVIMKIAPLRSGAPGGAWEVTDTTFADGQSIVKR
jgi:hypothetical protein